MCDGEEDCSDGSDERNCRKLVGIVIVVVVVVTVAVSAFDVDNTCVSSKYWAIGHPHPSKQQQQQQQNNNNGLALQLIFHRFSPFKTNAVKPQVYENEERRIH